MNASGFLLPEGVRVLVLALGQGPRVWSSDVLPEVSGPRGSAGTPGKDSLSFTEEMPPFQKILRSPLKETALLPNGLQTPPNAALLPPGVRLLSVKKSNKPYGASSFPSVAPGKSAPGLCLQ